MRQGEPSGFSPTARMVLWPRSSRAEDTPSAARLSASRSAVRPLATAPRSSSIPAGRVTVYTVSPSRVPSSTDTCR